MAHAAAPGEPFAADTFGGPATQPFDAVNPAEDTLIFSAVRDAPQGCRCGMPGCPDSSEPAEPAGRDAILSYAPGVVTRMAAERVRNGEWDDIPKCFREAGVRTHRPAVDRRAGIQADTEHGVLDLALMFDRTPEYRTDHAIAEGLARLEVEHSAWSAAVRANGWRSLPAQAEGMVPA